MKICLKCGRKFADSMGFCGDCGVKLDNYSEPVNLQKTIQNAANAYI